MELYMDEKWKLSKKGSRNGSRRGIAGEGGPFLKKSMSLKEGREMRRRSTTTTTTTTTARSFSSRCSSLAKEQRARFYIMRRCVTMLICWRDYA